MKTPIEIRTIKFRGQHNGEWKYGLLGMSGFDPAIIEGTNVWPVRPATVGQFTGMKTNESVDGKDLYEGDVVTMGIKGKDTAIKGVIVYAQNWGCYCVVGKDLCGYVASMQDGFVLNGNIFDNQDLMKEFGGVYTNDGNFKAVENNK